MSSLINYCARCAGRKKFRYPRKHVPLVTMFTDNYVQLFSGSYPNFLNHSHFDMFFYSKPYEGYLLGHFDENAIY